MALIKATVQLNLVSGILEDRPTNVFHFTGDVPSASVAGITGALDAFYDSINGLFPGTVAQSGHVIKLYNMDDPAPRAPFSETTFSLPSAPSGGPLPSEVALCLSYQAARQSGVSQARRRNRVYIGPLDTVNLGADGRPTAAAMSVLASAGTALRAASIASSTFTWVVYSPTSNTTALVNNGWVDNAYDTQRRRGLAPTTRTSWS